MHKYKLESFFFCFKKNPIIQSKGENKCQQNLCLEKYSLKVSNLYLILVFYGLFMYRLPLKSEWNKLHSSRSVQFSVIVTLAV